MTKRRATVPTVHLTIFLLKEGITDDQEVLPKLDEVYRLIDVRPGLFQRLWTTIGYAFRTGPPIRS